jgi:salicylate---[aryl-carrier protein] ligase
MGLEENGGRRSPARTAADALTGVDVQPKARIDGVAYPSERDSGKWLGCGAWLPMTISEALRSSAQASRDRLALVDQDTQLTYSQLDARATAFARVLLAAGLRSGDRVLLQLGVSTNAVVAIMGTFRAGLVPVCAVPQYREYEMGALADLARPKAHIIEVGSSGRSDLPALAALLREQRPELEHVIAIGDTVWVNDVLAEVETDTSGEECVTSDEIGPVDVAAFQLSGGTTGIPKIIPRFHGEYLGSASVWADRLQLNSDDVLLWSLPVTHNAGMLCFLLPVILRQATLVLAPRLDADRLLQEIAKRTVTISGTIGPIVAQLLETQDATRYDLSSVRTFVTINRAREIELHLGVPTMNIFGTTEGLLMASSPESTASARHDTVGRACSPYDEIRICEPQSEHDVATGEIGELCFRGPSTFTGYYGNPEATRTAFTSDGFFRTGDLVRAHQIGDHSFYSFEGRAKDNIDRGGEKFGTGEIELLLTTHPAVQDACLVGMPDPHLGERVCAFVVASDGWTAPTVDELATFLLQHGLAKFKLPERVVEISAMPQTAVGKYDRPALRRLVEDMLHDEAAT